MAASKKRASRPPGAIVEEVVRRKDDPRSASVPPEMVRDMGLDARLMSFLLSERPPLQLGSKPPDVVLDSIPPDVKARFRAPRLPAEVELDRRALAKTEPAPHPRDEEAEEEAAPDVWSPPEDAGLADATPEVDSAPEVDSTPETDAAPEEDSARVERVDSSGIGLPAAAPPAPPPPPKRSPEVRAKKLVKQLEFVGPGDEAPVVQALLKIGAPAIPIVTAEFPGLLWFHRQLPHVAVPRGRDVSPLARTLVAFGEAAHEAVGTLLGERDADRRFYALLVAQDLGAEAFVAKLPELAVDPDRQVREVAAATLLGLPAEVRAPARERLEQVLVDPRAPRVDRLEAVHALARLREEDSLEALVEVARDPTHRDLQQLAAGALTVLTGRPYGVDPEAWHRFAQKEGGAARIQWLIEAVRTTSDELLPVVLRELEELTGESLGEPDPSDARARKATANAYAKWWKQNGGGSRSLFGRLLRR